jgi:sterol 24-C-methyltransferase
MRVLDVGCGVGGPAREIARFADIKIIGINNNDFQIMRARRYTQKSGLQDQMSFNKADFMKLSEIFGEGSFDAGESLVPSYVSHLMICTVYAIEATCHAPTFEGIYGEILKVLKPGGIVSLTSLSSFSRASRCI